MAVTTNQSSEFVEQCNVNQAVEALFKVIAATSTKKKQKKQLFAEELEGKIILNVSLKIIPPQKNNKILNILLPNPVCASDTTRICFFVKDLVRKKSDHDETKIHYKEFFDTKGINFISEIIPLHQLRAEYRQHECRRQLCNSYDLFLMDSRLAAYMPKLLGKEFWVKKRFPQKIRMDDQHLKNDIQKTLDSTSFYIHGHGSTLVSHVGFATQTEKQIEENVLAIINYIGNKVPGGWINVRGIYIKTLTSLSIPIYVSDGSANDIVIEKKGKRRDKPVIDEMSTIEADVNVAVYPNGHVMIYRKRNCEGEVLSDPGKDDDITEVETVTAEEPIEENDKKPLQKKKVVTKTNEVDTKNGNDEKIEVVIEKKKFAKKAKLGLPKKRKSVKQLRKTVA